LLTGIADILTRSKPALKKTQVSIRSHYTYNKNKGLRPRFLPEITQIVNDETEKRQILEGNPKEIRAVKGQA
jgi:hypothetical protein